MRARAESLPLAAVGDRVTAAAVPLLVRVRVWVSKPGLGPVQRDGVATAWTSRAVRVQLVDGHGRSEEVCVGERCAKTT